MSDATDNRFYREPQRHICHWPGCERSVPPAMWGCKTHWFRLPKPLRDQVWKEYRPGQEISKTPSERYLVVAALVQGWIAGKVKVNPNGSIEVLEDLRVPGLSANKTDAPTP